MINTCPIQEPVIAGLDEYPEPTKGDGGVIVEIPALSTLYQIPAEVAMI